MILKKLNKNFYIGLIFVISIFLFDRFSKLYVIFLVEKKNSSELFLSAFLDALTVTAVLITVAVGFYSVYHRVASGKASTDASHNHLDNSTVIQSNSENLEQFKAFLRSLIMHGAVGTALGGVTTVVGEPQNLLIAEKAHLILPTHKVLDAASEAAKGKAKIGSTLRGIGPTYMDKTGRNGLRVGDILTPDFKAKYQKLKEKHLLEI